MFLRNLDLTTALRPHLFPDETLLFVQDGVGLYEGKFKIPKYQNGHVYLTSLRVCYVDNEEPRSYSVAVDLKEIDRPEFYAGFLKSSPKVTLFPKANRRDVGVRSPMPRYSSPPDGLGRDAQSPVGPSSSTPVAQSQINTTWICPICGLSNPVPVNFDPATANQYTTLPACQACGVKPPLTTLTKAAIAALSNRSSAPGHDPSLLPRSTGPDASAPEVSSIRAAGLCPRCTFQNHPSLTSCEVCGASLHTTSTSADGRSQLLAPESITRVESPGPSLAKSIVDDDTIETIKFSFRAGGAQQFLEKLKGALVQRKWLLQSAPPIPKTAASYPSKGSNCDEPFASAAPNGALPRVVGIAGLEQRSNELRRNNQAVIGTAFEDLEALMTSAKEVIEMAEKFRSQTSTADISSSERALLLDSASQLGLVTTKDMLGSGSGGETLYVTELSRNLAEFLTDDRRGVLKREGGIMSLLDLWAVFNRQRNGIELISPSDFEKAANMWETLHLPIRLRRFKSGLLVVQERSRTDGKTVASILSWLRESTIELAAHGQLGVEHQFGRGVTAQETAEQFHWSLGVATEELEMAEEMAALCRDQTIDGVRFWANHFNSIAFGEASEGLEAALGIGRLHI